MSTSTSGNDDSDDDKKKKKSTEEEKEELTTFEDYFRHSPENDDEIIQDDLNLLKSELAVIVDEILEFQGDLGNKELRQQFGQSLLFQQKLDTAAKHNDASSSPHEKEVIVRKQAAAVSSNKDTHTNNTYHSNTSFEDPDHEVFDHAPIRIAISH
jgi:hypothetical protein